MIVYVWAVGCDSVWGWGGGGVGCDSVCVCVCGGGDVIVYVWDGM